MSSHSAKELISHRPVSEGRIEATFVLACGCRVTREMRADRVQEIVGGGELLVGKFPCPEGHPVGHGR